MWMFIFFKIVYFKDQSSCEGSSIQQKVSLQILHVFQINLLYLLLFRREKDRKCKLIIKMEGPTTVIEDPESTSKLC
jgi:hypothetical protein